MIDGCASEIRHFHEQKRRKNEATARGKPRPCDVAKLAANRHYLKTLTRHGAGGGQLRGEQLQ
jgi:hypothetical protein